MGVFKKLSESAIFLVVVLISFGAIFTFYDNNIGSIDTFTGAVVGFEQSCSSSSQCEDNSYCGWIARGGYNGCKLRIADYQQCNSVEQDSCAKTNVTISSGLPESRSGVCRRLEAGTALPFGSVTSSGYYCLPPLPYYDAVRIPNPTNAFICLHDDQCQQGICNSPSGDFSWNNRKICLKNSLNTGETCRIHRQCSSGSCSSAPTSFSVGVCENLDSGPDITLQAASGISNQLGVPLPNRGDRIIINSNQPVSITRVAARADPRTNCRATSNPVVPAWNNLPLDQFGSGSGTIIFNQPGFMRLSVPTTFNLECSKTYTAGQVRTVFKSVFVDVVDPPVVSIEANPNPTNIGQQTTLRWSVQTNSGATCTRTGGMNSVTGQIWTSSNVGSNGDFIVNPVSVGNVNFRLRCMNLGGYTERDLNLNVGIAQQAVPPQITSFTANPSLVNMGSVSTLSWTTTNVASCVGSGGGITSWDSAKPLSGSLSVFPSSSRTYTLTCRNSVGASVSRSVTVTTSSQATNIPLTFTGNPITITRGQSATLRWVSPSATYCTSSQGISGERYGTIRWNGNVLPNSQFVTRPTTTTTYAMQCFGRNNIRSNVQYVNIIVNQPTQFNIQSFTFAPTNFGQPVRQGFLNWNTQGARSCSLSGGVYGSSTNVALNANNFVTGTTGTTYILSCTSSQDNSILTRAVTL